MSFLVGRVGTSVRSGVFFVFADLWSWFTAVPLLGSHPRRAATVRMGDSAGVVMQQADNVSIR